MQPSASLGSSAGARSPATYIVVTAQDASLSADLVTVSHELHEQLRNSRVPCAMTMIFIAAYGTTCHETTMKSISFVIAMTFLKIFDKIEEIKLI